MALEKINLGNTANDGKGDPLRVAFAKINNNFASLDLLGPMGPNGAIQYNNSNTFGGTSAFTLDASTNKLNLGVSIVPTQLVDIGQRNNKINTLHTNNLNLGNAAVSETGNVLTFGVSLAPSKLSSIKANALIADTTLQYGNAVTGDIGTAVSTSVGNSEQTILKFPAFGFKTGEFKIKSEDDNSLDNQLITIAVNKSPGIGSVRHTQYGTVFNGNATTRYNVTSTLDEIIVSVLPLTANSITHTITFSITRD